MIIFDRSDIIKDRKLFSARGAGILGFSIFGKDHFYAFDEKNKLREKELFKYLNKYKDEKSFNLWVNKHNMGKFIKPKFI